MLPTKLPEALLFNCCEDFSMARETTQDEDEPHINYPNTGRFQSLRYFIQQDTEFKAME